MPNWCENLLTVSGPIEDVRKFKLDGYLDDEQYLSAEKFLPTPKELLEENYERKKHFLDFIKPSAWDHPSVVEGMKELGISADDFQHNWSSWRCRYWGTKWDLNLEGHENSKEVWFDSDTDRITFDTAWEPPVALFNFIAKQYPTLRFKLAYTDGDDWNFAGYYIWKNGEQVKKEERKKLTREFAAKHLDWSDEHYDSFYGLNDEEEDTVMWLIP